MEFERIAADGLDGPPSLAATRYAEKVAQENESVLVLIRKVATDREASSARAKGDIDVLRSSLVAGKAQANCSQQILRQLKGYHGDSTANTSHQQSFLRSLSSLIPSAPKLLRSWNEVSGKRVAPLLVTMDTLFNDTTEYIDNVRDQLTMAESIEAHSLRSIELLGAAADALKPSQHPISVKDITYQGHNRHIVAEEESPVNQPQLPVLTKEKRFLDSAMSEERQLNITLGWLRSDREQEGDLIRQALQSLNRDLDETQRMFTAFNETILSFARFHSTLVDHPETSFDALTAASQYHTTTPEFDARWKSAVSDGLESFPKLVQSHLSTTSLRMERLRKEIKSAKKMEKIADTSKLRLDVCIGYIDQGVKEKLDWRMKLDSVARRIGEAVWKRVFVALVDIETVDLRKSLEDHLCSPRAAMTVAAVCQTWREVALATSILWKNVPAPKVGKERDAFSGKELYRFYAELSKGQALTLIVEGTFDGLTQSSFPLPYANSIQELSLYKVNKMPSSLGYKPRSICLWDSPNFAVDEVGEVLEDIRIVGGSQGPAKIHLTKPSTALASCTLVTSHPIIVPLSVIVANAPGLKRLKVTTRGALAEGGLNVPKATQSTVPLVALTHFSIDGLHIPKFVEYSKGVAIFPNLDYISICNLRQELLQRPDVRRTFPTLVMATHVKLRCPENQTRALDPSHMLEFCRTFPKMKKLELRRGMVEPGLSTITHDNKNTFFPETLMISKSKADGKQLLKTLYEFRMSLGEENVNKLRSMQIVIDDCPSMDSFTTHCLEVVVRGSTIEAEVAAGKYPSLRLAIADPRRLSR